MVPAQAVGDGLVASRFEIVHGLDTGDDKRRPTSPVPNQPRADLFQVTGRIVISH